MPFDSWKVGERSGVTLQAWQLTCEEYEQERSWSCGLLGFLFGFRIVCLFCFPFGAGNSIIDGNSAGFNNFQNETWVQGLLRLMRDKNKTQIPGHLGVSESCRAHFIFCASLCSWVPVSANCGTHHATGGMDERPLWSNSCSKEGAAQLRAAVLAAVVETSPDLV